MQQEFYGDRIKLCLKIGIAGIICILIGNLFHLESFYLSTLFTFLVMSQFKGKVFRAGLQGVLISLIFGAVSIVISNIFYDIRIIYLLIMCSCLFLCTTLVNVATFGALVGSILVGVIMFITVFESVEASNHMFYIYITQLTLAFIVSSLVDKLIFPSRSIDKLNKAFYLSFDTLSKTFHDLNDIPHVNNSTDRMYALGLFDQINTFIKQSINEKRSEDFHGNLYIKLSALLRDVYVKSELINTNLTTGGQFLLNETISNSIQYLNETISSKFNEIKKNVQSAEHIEILDKTAWTVVENLEQKYTELHNLKDQDLSYYKSLLSVGSILEIYRTTLIKLNKIIELSNLIANPKQYKTRIQSRLPRNVQVEKIKTITQTLFDKKTLKQSSKIIIIFLILLVGELYFDFPGQYQVAFYGILFGLLPNIGQSHHKTKLGIIGVILGLLFGIFGNFIIFHIHSFIILCLLYFLATFIFSYVASGSAKYDFIGLQAGLMIPFSLLYNLDAASTRVEALIISSAVGLTVLHFVWPIIPINELRKNISKSLTTSGLILKKLLKLDEGENEQIKKLVIELAATLPTINSLFNDAKYLVDSDDKNTEEYLTIIEKIEFIYIELENLNNIIYYHFDNKLVILYLSSMKEAYENLFQFFDKVANQFTSNAAVNLDLESLGDEIESKRERFRKSEVWKKFSNEDLERNVLIAKSIDDLLDCIIQINQSVNLINSNKQNNLSALTPIGEKL